MHRNAQTLGDAIREFFEDNAELRGKIQEIRVLRAWGEILGPMVAQYTCNIYIKDKVPVEISVCRSRTAPLA